MTSRFRPRRPPARRRRDESARDGVPTPRRPQGRRNAWRRL